MTTTQIENRIRQLEKNRASAQNTASFRKTQKEVCALMDELKARYNSPEAKARRKEKYELLCKWAEMRNNHHPVPDFNEYLVSVGFITEEYLRKYREDSNYFTALLNKKYGNDRPLEYPGYPAIEHDDLDIDCMRVRNETDEQN